MTPEKRADEIAVKFIDQIREHRERGIEPYHLFNEWRLLIGEAQQKAYRRGFEECRERAHGIVENHKGCTADAECAAKMLRQIRALQPTEE